MLAMETKRHPLTSRAWRSSPEVYRRERDVSWSSGLRFTETSFGRTGLGLATINRLSPLSPFGEISTIEFVRSIPLLEKATVSGGHTVHVCFEDGLAADVDLSYLLDFGGVFEPLRDPEYFGRLRADPEAGTIVWPNQADIAPETLYARAQISASTP